MRPIFLFFVFLCFLSAGLNNRALGNFAANGTSMSQVNVVKKANQVQIGERGDRHLSVKRAVLSEDAPSILSDEDDDNTAARKYLLPALCALILYYAIVANFPGIYCKERLPFCSHLSHTSAYKYILQRSLRI